MIKFNRILTVIAAFILTLVSLDSAASGAGLVLGPEQVVRAGGSDISVPGYSVPSFVHWDGDGLKDLVVGEGSGLTGFGRVRVYINSGSPGNPVFTGYFYAQAEGSDLQSPGGG